MLDNTLSFEANLDKILQEKNIIYRKAIKYYGTCQFIDYSYFPLMNPSIPMFNTYQEAQNSFISQFKVALFNLDSEIESINFIDSPIIKSHENPLTKAISYYGYCSLIIYFRDEKKYWNFTPEKLKINQKENQKLSLIDKTNKIDIEQSIKDNAILFLNLLPSNYIYPTDISIDDSDIVMTWESTNLEVVELIIESEIIHLYKRDENGEHKFVDNEKFGNSPGITQLEIPESILQYIPKDGEMETNETKKELMKELWRMQRNIERDELLISNILNFVNSIPEIYLLPQPSRPKLNDNIDLIWIWKGGFITNIEFSLDLARITMVVNNNVIVDRMLTIESPVMNKFCNENSFLKEILQYIPRIDK